LVNPLEVARRNRRYATDRIDLRFADRGLKATATGDSPQRIFEIPREMADLSPGFFADSQLER
jgi:hypothetical protein